ncbi:hypothetical protein V2J09_004912 [Rumex salicifolius]
MVQKREPTEISVACIWGHFLAQSLLHLPQISALFSRTEQYRVELRFTSLQGFCLQDLKISGKPHTIASKAFAYNSSLLLFGAAPPAIIFPLALISSHKNTFTRLHLLILQTFHSHGFQLQVIPLLAVPLQLLLRAMVVSLGINYGQIANNLPSPEEVIPLAKSVGATKLKLYDADPVVLKAFANTDVEFMVCIGNNLLASMRDPKQAQDWIKQNVQSHLPATSITTIVVGNEILASGDIPQSQNLLPAMQGVYAALVSLGLDKQVAVTTAHSLSILETSYPPSAGAFREDVSNYISQILNFHMKTGSPFLINAYPFFAYKADPKRVSLDFVLFQPNQGIVDPASGLHYDNMLFAQIDAVYSALASLGYKKVPVHISETGWPSKGDEDEVGATPDNARKYNGNLIKLMAANKGTPMRPDSDLNIFIFAMFNENMKPGPASERNYGLFKPDGTPAYALAITGVQALGNSSSGQFASGYPSPDSALTGYLSISSAAVSETSMDFFTDSYLGGAGYAVKLGFVDRELQSWPYKECQKDIRNAFSNPTYMNLVTSIKEAIPCLPKHLK